MGKLERMSRTLVKHGAIIDIYDDEMKLPNGDIEHWDFVHHRMGAAAVVPVLPSGEILLVRQYRPALGRYTWELPAGCRDHVDEPTETAAKRELTEETGYSSDEFFRLLSLKTTVAFADELVDVYLAKNIKKIGKQDLDPAEDIELKKWDLDTLLDMIYAGEIQDGKTVSGILAYFGTLHR
ncbi:MAG: NUDIX hydrolase [Lachnospiraceae bacterium]|nr:NUDIX hydrolase [Lachnospiraceae bacterium]